MYYFNLFIKTSISIASFYILTVEGCGPVRKLEDSTINWSYSGHKNSIDQTRWNHEIKTCNGKQQSPIHIITADLNEGNPKDKISFTKSSCTSFDFVKNDHGYVWKKNQNQKLNKLCNVTVSSSQMSLAQFHIHIPSEHIINGKKSDVELHFVHTDEEQKNYRVVGIRMNIMPNVWCDHSWMYRIFKKFPNFVRKNLISKKCTENAWIKDIFDTFPTEGTISILDSYKNIIKTKGGFYNYKGSLTTPPCSETVDWWLMKETISISKSQYNIFLNQMKKLNKNLYGTNARDVQELNGRKITFYE